MWLKKGGAAHTQKHNECLSSSAQTAREREGGLLVDLRPRWLTARECSPYRAWLKVDLLILVRLLALLTRLLQLILLLLLLLTRLLLLILLLLLLLLLLVVVLLRRKMFPSTAT